VEEIATPGAAADATAAAAAAAAADLASAFPLRVAYFHTFAPRERVRIVYDRTRECATLEPVVEEASLPALDGQMAAYPFAGLEGWKALSTHISAEVVKRVKGEGLVFVDSLTGEEGGDEIGALRAAVAANARRAEGEGEGAGEEEKSDTKEEEAHRLQFPVFDLKRSWPAGAAGDALSRWSRDKSAQLARVCREVGGESTTRSTSSTVANSQAPAHFSVISSWPFCSSRTCGTLPRWAHTSVSFRSCARAARR
jgi:hypothetical protein